MFVRIEQFAFKPGAEVNGVPLLREHGAFIKKSAGCLRAYVGSPYSMVRKSDANMLAITLLFSF